MFWLLFMLLVVPSGVGDTDSRQALTFDSPERGTKSGTAMTLRLAVARALPVVGEGLELTGRIGYRGQVSQEAEMRFSYRTGQQEVPLGEAQRITLSPGGEEIVVRQNWTPEHTGDYTLLVRLLGDGTAPSDISQTAKQTITVVGRRLHLHYWEAHPILKYITEGRVSEKDQLAYWTDRGVVGQRWRGGKWAYERAQKRTEESLGDYWAEPYREGWPGIVIDEFTSSEELNEILGRGLLAARKEEPNVYLAVYTTGWGGQDQLRSFREAADRVLIEVYDTDATYGYNRILKRCRPAQENGLGDKALAVLGIGEALGAEVCAITTPQELRRQLHFTRYHYPAMPGVAFFSRMEPLYPALNDQIRHFYINPVLRVEELENGQFRIENIGSDRSPATQVKLRAKDKRGQTIECDVPSLAIGQQHLTSAADRKLQAVTEYRPDCYVLGPPALWDQEPAEFRPNAKAPWPGLGQVFSRVEETFDARPPLQIEYDTSGIEGYEGNVTAASYAIPATQRRACELRFDLHPVRTGFYGKIHIGLLERGGKSQLDLSLYRGDYQAGVYVQVTVKNVNGLTVKERLAQVVESGRTYHLKARYEPQGYVRVAIVDQGRKVLWDTGEIPTYGEVTFDQVRFGVRSGRGSKLEWDRTRKAMLLCGTTSPDYMLSAYVDNVEVDCFSDAPSP